MKTNKKNRQIEIESVLEKLKQFKVEERFADKLYAIEENIRFAEAIKSLPRYIWWLITRAPKIDGSRLLELTDFPVEEWDVKMHGRLIEMERRDRPGLAKPLTNRIAEFIFKENRPLVLVNLGAGGMEVDRQVISLLLEKKYDKPIIFIGVDKSPITHNIAKENLSSLGERIGVFDLDILTKDKLEEIAKGNRGVSVVLCKNDIFDLNAQFPQKYFDLVYSSLFKHHLDESSKEKIDKTVREISKKYLEYDGYRSFPHLIPQSLVAWGSPIFLNGTVFSMLRYKTKNNLNFPEILFFKNTAHYLREF